MTNNRRFVFPALLTAGVLWGTTVPLSKVALGWLPPGWLAFVRFALAAAILLVASRSRLRAAFSPAIMITGAIGYGGSVLLQNFGIDRTSVTHAALLIGATPVLVAITAAVLRHSVARPLAWAGFAISLAGVAFVAGGQGSGSSLAGDGLVLAAQLISAGFTVSQARLLRGRDPIAVTGLQLLGAAIVVLPVALITEHQAAGPGSLTAVLATIGLVLAGTVLPTSLFAFGQSRVSADVAGAFLNLEPLVGAIMGMALFAEPAGPTQLAGGTAISVGIGLSTFQVIRGQRRHASTPSGVGAPSEVSMPSGVSVTSPVTVSSGRAPGRLSAPGTMSMQGETSADSHAGTRSLGSASAGAAAEAADSSVAVSQPAPGEAPSVVKRTKFPRPRPAGTARVRRPRFRPSGHPESAAHPAHRTSRSRRERDRGGRTGLP
jgi:O-acetylserine/cysteine efflux transporter